MAIITAGQEFHYRSGRTSDRGAIRRISTIRFSIRAVGTTGLSSSNNPRRRCTLNNRRFIRKPHRCRKLRRPTTTIGISAKPHMPIGRMSKRALVVGKESLHSRHLHRHNKFTAREHYENSQTI